MPRDRIILRSDTAANLASVVLRAGEVAWATDDEELKIGDGATAFSALPVLNGGGGGGGAPDWGDIGGTLAYQTDLQAALDAKAASTHTHAQSDITNLTTDLAAKGDASMLFGSISDTSTTSNTVYTSVIGSDVTVEAGKTYAISWRMRTYSAVATTGVRLRRALGGGAAGTVVYQTSFVGSSATAGFTRASRAGTNDPALGTGNATNSTDQSAALWVDMLFTCTTGGTIGLEMASEVNASGAFITGDGSGWFAVARTT